MVTDGLFDSGIRNFMMAEICFGQTSWYEDCLLMADLVRGAAGGDKRPAPHAFNWSMPRINDDPGFQITCEREHEFHKLVQLYSKLGPAITENTYGRHSHDDPDWEKALRPEGKRSVVSVFGLDAFSSSAYVEDQELNLRFDWWHDHELTLPYPKPKGSPGVRHPHRAFELAQLSAPTVLATSGQFWATAGLSYPARELFRKDTVTGHYLSRGYFVAHVRLSGQGHAMAVLFIPPLPKAVDLLRALQPAHGARFTLREPTQDAIDGFFARHPQHVAPPPAQEEGVETEKDPAHPEPDGYGAGMAGTVTLAALMAGGAIYLCARDGQDRRARGTGPLPVAGSPGGVSRQDAPPAKAPRKTPPVERPALTQTRPAPPPQSPDNKAPADPPLPRDEQEAFFTAQAHFQGQLWRAQQVAARELAPHIGGALLAGKPAIAAAILWVAYEHVPSGRRKDLMDALQVNGEALREIRKSLTLLQRIETDDRALEAIKTALWRMDIITLIWGDPAGTELDTKRARLDRKAGTDGSKPSQRMAARTTQTVLPTSKTQATKSANDTYQYFLQLVKSGAVRGVYRPDTKDLFIPDKGSYPHLHLAFGWMVYTSKPGAGHPIIFARGGVFQPAIFDRVRSDLPENDKGAEIRKVLDYVANGVPDSR